MSAWPGGHHSRDGLSGQRTGPPVAGSSFGTRCWQNASGRPPGLAKPGCSRARAARVSASVEKLFMSRSGSGARQRRRRNSTWRTMMSRKESPFFAMMRDLACSRPMLVPRPPLSLMIAVRARADSAPGPGRSSSSRRGRGPSGARAAPEMVPSSPAVQRRVFRRKASITSGGSRSAAIFRRISSSRRGGVMARRAIGYGTASGTCSATAARSAARRWSRSATCTWCTRSTSPCHWRRGSTRRRSTGRYAATPGWSSESR